MGMIWIAAALVAAALTVLVIVLLVTRSKEKAEIAEAEKEIEQKTAQTLHADRKEHAQPMPERTPRPKPPKPPTRPSAEKPAEQTPAIASYPPYDHSRSVQELGLSEEEALTFVKELIAQLGAEIPKLETEVAKGNVGKIELTVHMLKGSAVNLGSGGIADVLTDFNRYCHEGSDMAEISRHMANLKHYFENLKQQYH